MFGLSIVGLSNIHRRLCTDHIAGRARSTHRYPGPGPTCRPVAGFWQWIEKVGQDEACGYVQVTDNAIFCRNGHILLVLVKRAEYHSETTAN